MNTPAAGRRISRIVVEYADGTGFTLEHKGQGGEIDGLVLSEALMDRLRYEDDQQPGRCMKPQRETGQDWRRRRRKAGQGNSGGPDESITAMSNGDGDCIYVHSESCSFVKICDWDV